MGSSPFLRLSHRMKIRALGAMAALVIALPLGLSGCVAVTSVQLNSGSDAGPAHRIVVSFEATRDGSGPVRGVVGLRIPEAWEVESVSFTGDLTGTATRSIVMERVYAQEWEASVGPGYNGPKPGYEWWVGYSPAGTWVEGDEAQVTFEIDTHGRGGTYLLDLVTGIADEGSAPADIEDVTNDHALWYLGSAGAKPAGVLLDQAVTVYAFTDVHPGAAHFDAIQGMASRGLVAGYPTGEGHSEFRPAAAVFRAQFAKMIDGALGLTVEEAMAPPVLFTDLGPDDATGLYPHEYVWAAYQQGIIKGYSTGVFKPYVAISRGQVVTVTVRALQARRPAALAAPPTGYVQTWGNDLSSEHRANAAVAEYNGLLEGLLPGTAAADGNAPMSRGEVAQLLWNMMAFIGP
ncbi:MAG: S-layer homology domain-containing protein [Actinomycetia bacterium]|nr:S-layer homology domain-containing protein [Actinomycetes bacterium]